MKYHLTRLMIMLACAGVYGSASGQNPTDPPRPAPAMARWTHFVELPIAKNCKCAIGGDAVQELVWTGIEAGHGVPIKGNRTDTKTATINVDVTDHKLCPAGTFAVKEVEDATEEKRFGDGELIAHITGGEVNESGFKGTKTHDISVYFSGGAEVVPNETYTKKIEATITCGG